MRIPIHALGRERLAAAAAAAALLSGTIALAPSPAFAKGETDEALRLARKWQGDDGPVTNSSDGRVLFLFGRSRPTVVCAIFTVCDIGLEVGEVIDSVNLGDAARWDVQQARVGEPGFLTEHLVIKPLDTELRTTMFIATNRRAYMIELVSDDTDAMSKVGFLYPNSAGGARAGDGDRRRATDARGTPRGDVALLPPPDPAREGPAVVVRDTAPVGDEVVAGNLDFGYRIGSADVPWRPIRAYDDGRRTFIDLDRDRVASAELPVLLVNDTDRRGGMINYRYDTERARFVVDGLFDSASLVLGKGGRGKKVRIRRVGAGSGGT